MKLKTVRPAWAASLFILGLLVLPRFVFAEQRFALRLGPEAVFPMGHVYFGSGLGGLAGLDWAPFSFLGLGLSGSYSALAVEDGSRVSLLEGSGGPFLRLDLSDRVSIRADGTIGIYRIAWNRKENTRGRLGAVLSGEFRISPSLSLTVFEAYTWYNNEPALHSLSAGAAFNFNLGEILRPRTRVLVEKAEQRRVFPVSYTWYEDNEIASIRITNNEPYTITDVRLSFFLERYMKDPTVFAVLPRMGSGETAELPVTALFNESMLELTENAMANALIRIEYRSLGALKESIFPLQMPVYHRNAMSWDDDRRASSFVSARDPAAVLFARYTASALRRLNRRGVSPESPVSAAVPENVRLAAAVFEALNLYGVNYVIDPASSYAELSESDSGLDSLNYPYQTLFYRGGDCDDLSILYCSLLEVLNIDTAFITIPGHIYTAFDTGLETEGGTEETMTLLEDDLIRYRGRLWMPVETTIPQEGFAEAWRVGARQWREARKIGQYRIETERSGQPRGAAADEGPLSAGEIGFHPMRRSWTVYPAVSVPGAGDFLPAMPEGGAITRAATAQLEKLAPKFPP